MKAYRCQGAITVFLSLISVLLLSLLCTAVESARVQGCRAKGAAALDMGLFSLFGSYEKGVLDRYDVFFLDGAEGTGSFGEEKLNDRLTEYMEYNIQPGKGLLLQGFDPFRMTLEKTQILGFQLATDEKGAAFYQQAVRFMKENMGTEMVSELLKRRENAGKMEEAGKLYEEREKKVSEQMKRLEEEQKKIEQEKKEQEKIEAEENNGEVLVPETEAVKVPDSKNPLAVIGELKKRGLVKLMLGDQKISEKKLSWNLPSTRWKKKGNLPVKKENSGLTADLLFQEYLFGRFSQFCSEKKAGVLDYELEYILCGKKSDEKNLKSVINRLLLMREGANFLYLMNDPLKKQEADAMALLLTGWIPVAGVQTVTSYALILAWACGESLLDVRELLAGGKVPLLKEADTWKLSLSQIPELVGMLDRVDGSGGSGLSYEEYLQILFMMGSSGKYPMRALDLIEGYVRTRPGLESFRADHMVTKVKAKAEYCIPAVFLRVSGVFLKTGTAVQDYEIWGSFSY